MKMEDLAFKSWGFFVIYKLKVSDLRQRKGRSQYLQSEIKNDGVG